MSDECHTLTSQLAEVIGEEGVAAERRPDCVVIEGTDILLAITSIWNNPDKPPPGRQRTFGIQIGIKSPRLFRQVVYEYSYGSGRDDGEAAKSALRRWARLDLPVLTEAAAGRAKACLLLQKASDGSDAGAAGLWRIYVGPLDYVAGAEGARPCCQACLVTASLPVLLPLMAKPVSFSIKIVASKDEDGATSADCRRDGEDLPEAIAFIAEAAKVWPPIAGTQIRRQYLYFEAPSGPPPMWA